eukprot:scaffold51458_cov24-Cyclotella_meneghiniana.AAC.3
MVSAVLEVRCRFASGSRLSPQNLCERRDSCEEFHEPRTRAGQYDLDDEPSTKCPFDDTLLLSCGTDDKAKLWDLCLPTITIVIMVVVSRSIWSWEGLTADPIMNCAEVDWDRRNKNGTMKTQQSAGD